MPEPIRFECVNCRTDWPEAFCDGCGRSLIDSPLYADPHEVAAVAEIGARVIRASEHVWGEHHPVTEAVRATNRRLLFDMGPVQAGLDRDDNFSRRVREPLRLVTK